MGDNCGDVLRLETRPRFAQRSAHGEPRCLAVEPHVRQHIVETDGRRGRAHDQHLEQPPQLFAVAAPRQRGKHALRRIAQLLGRKILAGAEQVQQVHGQFGDVLAALAQRRHVDAHAAEPLVQIRQHPAVLDRGVERRIARRDDAMVEHDARPLVRDHDLAVAQYTQQPGLQSRR